MSQDYLSYEAARRRVEDRRKRRKFFIFNLLVFLGVGAFFGWVASLGVTEQTGISCGVVLVGIWGVVVAGQGLEVYLQSARRMEKRAEVVQSELQKLFGIDWRQAVNPAVIDAVQRKVERRERRRGQLVIHSAVFGVVFLLMWLPVLMNWANATQSALEQAAQRSAFGMAVFITVIWGAVLGLQALSTLTSSKIRLSKRELAVHSEIERELELASLAKNKEKPKHSRLTIGDDGELVELEAEESENTRSLDL